MMATANPTEPVVQHHEPTFARIVTFVVVALAPLVSFPLGTLFGPEWQNGQLSDRVALQLQPEVTVNFAPFIVVAWLSMLTAIASERHIARWRATRFVLYSSVVMTLHYLLVTTLALTGVSTVIGVLVVAMWAGVLALQRRFGSRVFLWILGLGLGVWLPLALVSIIANGGASEALLYPIVLPLLVLVLSGPTICFAVAVHRSLRVWRLAGASTTGTADTALTIAGTSAWVGGYAFAWRRAAAKAVELYEELPVEQPMCYIATAAANGHPGFVRSSASITDEGESFAVTRQLQSLKLAEVVLAARWPRTHRRLRRVYDRVGPVAASRLNSPLRADVAYVLLKPFEAVGVAIAACALSDRNAIRSRIYRPQMSSRTRAR